MTSRDLRYLWVIDMARRTELLFDFSMDWELEIKMLKLKIK